MGENNYEHNTDIGIDAFQFLQEQEIDMVLSNIG
jgi:hypothetical protein